MRYDGPDRFPEPVREADLLRLVAELRRIINEFELGSAPRWKRRTGIVRKAATLNFDELAIVDSAEGDLDLALPVPDKAGKGVRIHRRSASNAITLTPTGGVRLNGVTTPITVPAAIGAYEYFWDGEEWAGA